MCQLGDLLVTAPAALRNQLDTRRTPQGTAAVCARLRPDTDRLADPAQAANPALRSLGRRLDRLVATAAPTTLSRRRCGTHHTATLHMIVIVRLRYCQRTRSYTDRRLAEGKTKKEAIRCLKRFVAPQLYRTLRADLATLTTRT